MKIKFVVLDARSGERQLGWPMFDKLGQRIGQVVVEQIPYDDHTRQVSEYEFNAEDRRVVRL